jgi:predicted PurR-regulated permease PerM
MSNSLTKPFLLILLFLVLLALYLVFSPFLTEILVAAILVSVFYKNYQRLLKVFKGRRHLTSLVMCLLLVVIIILPLSRIIIYGGEQSTKAYSQAVEFFNQYDIDNVFESPIFTTGPLSSFNLVESDQAVQEFFLDIMRRTSDWLMAGATIFLKETTNFIVSLILIILTMFFFFIDGEKILRKLMYLSPLPNKYDQEIFLKFREVSYTSMMSTFVTAAAQGLVGAIGFAIVGFPALLAGILVALLSLLPYLGSMIFYLPMGIYYLLAGQVWQGIFILAWGLIIIGNTDNIIRAYMIHGKAQVNPIFIIFSILGGIMMFGFWGVVIGPLIIAIVATIFHIYELEYCNDLDGDKCGELLKNTKKPKKNNNK